MKEWLTSPTCPWIPEMPWLGLVAIGFVLGALFGVLVKRRKG